MAAVASWPRPRRSATSRMPIEGSAMNRSRRGLSQHRARLASDQRGVSSVEFAMLLPLMITLYLGTVEVSQGVGIDRKVTMGSRTVAGLASQVSSTTGND